MQAPTFFKQLALITVPTAAAVYFVHQVPVLKAHSLLGWLSLLFFVCLSVFMFFTGRAAALSKNKNAFTNAFLVFLMMKLFLCGGIMIGYLKLTEPDTKLFVLPFFGLYIIYTTFEVFFLISLGKLQQPKAPLN
jgi:hypothetical protein